MPSRVDAPPAPSGRSLLASASWMTGSNLIAQAFAYGSLVLLARWLDPANFGTVAVGTTIVGIGALFVDQGTWGSVVVERKLNRIRLARAFRRCMLMAVVLAATIAATATVLVHHFATGGSPGALAAIAICLPLHAIAVVPTALLQRAMQFRRLAGVTATANIASALIAVVLALHGAGVWALVSRQIVLFALVAALSAWLCLPELRSHNHGMESLPTMKDGVRIERWFFLFAVAFAVTGSLDKLVIGVFGGAAVVGIYSIASAIAMAPWTQFSAMTGQVLFAATASHPTSVVQRTEQSARLMSLLMLPLIPVGTLTAPVILPKILGEEWAPVVPVFQMLLIVGVGNAVVSCIAEPLTGTGQMPFRTRIMLGQCIATLLALLILVPTAGILGAAIAHFVVFVPYAVIFFTTGVRRIGSSPGDLLQSLRPGFAILALEALFAFVALLLFLKLGVSRPIALCCAAAVGFAMIAPILIRAIAKVRSI